VDNVVGRLGEILETRRMVSIGVAHLQLVIEGVATDPRHPVLSDLARRLHGHQLGAISLAKGTNTREVESLLQLLAREGEREGDRVGLWPADRLPRWEFAKVYPVGYDRLEREPGAEDVSPKLDRATSSGRLASRRWRSTSRWTPGEHRSQGWRAIKAPPRGRVRPGHRRHMLARGRAPRRRRAASSRARSAPDVRADEDWEDTLARLVEMGNEAQQALLLDANEPGGERSSQVLRAAAAASEQSISEPLTRLLSKLAVHAEAGGERMRVQADTALRENVERSRTGSSRPGGPVRRCSTRWPGRIRSSAAQRARGLSGSLRIVQMAIDRSVGPDGGDSHRRPVEHPAVGLITPGGDAP
jgi:hypothetical protein